ncbi:hypothetical protein MRX96_029734 [Rhipicephalus microplus]
MYASAGAGEAKNVQSFALRQLRHAWLCGCDSSERRSALHNRHCMHAAQLRRRVRFSVQSARLARQTLLAAFPKHQASDPEWRRFPRRPPRRHSCDAGVARRTIEGGIASDPRRVPGDHRAPIDGWLCRT